MSAPRAAAVLRFRLVDVFTRRRFTGNALAVVDEGADRLEGDAMQRIAREFNLSETSFVLTPRAAGAHARVRIFTPARELPFAGHPTLGTAFVLARGGIGSRDDVPGEVRLVLEEPAGLVPVTVRLGGGGGGFARLTAPPAQFGPCFEDRDALAGVLSLAPSDLADAPVPQAVSCGVPFLFVAVRSLDAVRRIRFRPERWEALRGVPQSEGVFLFTLEAQDPGSTVHGRAFIPSMGIAEDPATGAAAAPLGCLLAREGLLPPPAGGREAPSAAGANALERASLVLEQGYEMGRPSLLHVEVDHAGGRILEVRVGGDCVEVGAGTLEGGE